MPTRRKELDPVGNYNFVVDIDGITSGKFAGVDGLSLEVEMIEYRVSDDPMTPRFRPGLPKYGRITLKRGYLSNPDLIKWLKDVQNGTYVRKNITLKLMDNIGSGKVSQWDLMRCLPSKWSIGGLDGKGNEVVYESVELVVEEIRQG